MKSEHTRRSAPYFEKVAHSLVACPATSMINLLKRVGIATLILDMIHEIVQTCASCRAWSKPLPASIASVGMADHFNAQVEADIVFIYAYSIFHLVDRCTRWHATHVTPSKEETSLVTAIDEACVKCQGPYAGTYHRL